MPRPTTAELQGMKTQLESMIEESRSLIENLKSMNANATQMTSNIQEKSETLNQAHTEGSDMIRQISEGKAEAEEGRSVIQELSEQAVDVQSRLEEYERTYKRMIASVDQLRSKVESFLPGATSAGLASAFHERKKSFSHPKKMWNIIFIACLLLLFGLALFDHAAFPATDLTASTFFSYLLSRLPVIAPILWLAIYASRRHSQALRLEEDYAHKESWSKSFEGYKNQVVAVEKDSEPKVTRELISKAIEALALHPGRIYTGKQETITPLHEVKSAIESNKESPRTPE